ncbi:TolC family protein [Hymenobacter sp. NBH84]|nr:TolC family protein [Hymenobacter sp. NBH84]
MKKIFGFLVLVLPLSSALGQTTAPPTEDWQTIFFESPAIALPRLMEAAGQHSKQVKVVELDKTIKEQDIQIAKEEILGSVTLGGNYGYGNVLNGGVYDPANPTQVRTITSTRYFAGATVGFPLTRIISRGNLIKREQMAYQQAELTRQGQIDAIRQQIIQLYQNVLLAKKLLTLQQEAYVTVKTNYQLSERQFRQGQLPLAELSVASAGLTGAAIAQETALNQYNTSFMLLEEVVGTKISTLMTTAR